MSNDGDQEDEDEGSRPAPLQRSAVISGFNNLKKELSILSPLRHPSIVQLYGVATKPLFGNVVQFQCCYFVLIRSSVGISFQGKSKAAAKRIC